MKIKVEYYCSYIPTEDKTIVWQDLIAIDNHDEQQLIQTALVGWYCGEPDDKVTKDYCSMPTIGQFIDMVREPTDSKRRGVLTACRKVVKDHYTVNHEVIEPEENNRLLTLINSIDDLLK